LEQRIKERYSQSILKEAMERYAIGDDQIRLLDGFESYMYEFRHDGAEYILRIGHSLRRSVDLILGEVDWINYLARGGASVSRAIESKDGNLVEQIDDNRGGRFLATAFVRAGGDPPGADQWNSDLFVRHGQLIGRMHALSKGYQPPDPAWKRLEWDDQQMLFSELWLPQSEDLVLGKFRDVFSSLLALPRSGANYGLIHQDAHGGNFFVDSSGQITLFDFDDCAYSWYANDIAIVLFYAAFGEEDPPTFTRNFMKHFLQGYIRENDFDPRWLVQFPQFLKLREIDLFAVIHRSFDVEDIQDRWVASFMKNRKEMILNDVPFIDLDFGELSEFVSEASISSEGDF